MLRSQLVGVKSQVGIEFLFHTPALEQDTLPKGKAVESTAAPTF